ncbi:MAG: autotransporter-associated beta strand repeat-containing protein, partial [Gammaproteobacteria bacterium]
MINSDDAPNSSQFSGVISGAGGLTVSRTGASLPFPLEAALDGEQRTLVLNGINTYAGGTRVESGAIVRVSTDANLGSGAVTLARGALLHSGTSSNVELVLSNGGRIATDGNDLEFSGDISGTGSLVKSGPGVLTLSGNNSWIGDTWIIEDGSYIALADLSRLGSGDVVLAGSGGLRLLDDIALTKDLRVIDNGILDTGVFTATSSGNIFGVDPAAQLSKRGTGTLVIDGNSLFAGTIAASAGTIQVGTGGTSGSLGGNVIVYAGSRLLFDRAGTLNVGGDITGDGTVEKTGSGTVYLQSVNNSFSGGLRVSGGHVAAASDSALGTGGIVLDNGGLDLRGTLYASVDIGPGSGDLYVDSGTEYYGGSLSGSGLFRKTGAGTLVISSESQLAGGTRVEAGTLQLGNGSSGMLDSDIEIAAGAVLAFSRDDAATYSGDVVGAGLLQKTGFGELTVTGDIAHAGGTGVLAGVLRVGDGGTGGSIAGDVDLQSAGTLVFARSDAVTYGGALSGTGTVRQDGLGTLTVSGDNSAFTGLLDVTRGTLALDGTTGGNVQVQFGYLAGSGHVAGNVDVGAGGGLRPGSFSAPLQVGG